MSGWLILLLVLFLVALLAFLKLGVHIIYNDEDLRLRILVGELRIRVASSEHPSPKKKKLSPKAKVGSKKVSKKPWIKAAFAHWADILFLVGRILTSPTMEKLKLRVMVGNEDPEACAITYGRVCGAVAAILPPLENTFTVKRRDVQVMCCFERDKMQVEAETVVVLRVYQIVAIAVAALRLILSIYSEVNNTDKKVVENV